MIEPTGYTALDLIGFTDRGVYDPDAYYVKNDITSVGNTKWRCLIDDTHNVTPTEGANWTIYLESATSLAGMDDVTLTSPKNGDGLVHDGNDWKNVPIVTQEMQDILGAKNLLPNTASTMVDSGVTFTVNSDGTIQTSDTASATTFIDLPVPRSLGGRVVKLSGCPIGGAYGKYRCICMADGTDIANDIGNGSTFTIPNNFTSCVVRCLVYTGYGNGLTFKPMITLASQPNSDYAHYVPYAKTNRELTEDVAIEDISSGVSYASGVTGTDVTFDVKRIGKLVIFTFMISTGSLMPTAGWGATQILTGLPKSSSADRARISGATLTNKIPFAVVVNASGLCTIVKLQGGASTDTLPPYFGGVITYIEQ